MDNRRLTPSLPASPEELQLWAQAAASLSTLVQVHEDSVAFERMSRMNKMLSNWSIDELSSDGLDGLRTLSNLESGLQEIKNSAENESQLIENALENISVLITLRKTSETILPPAHVSDKRARRQQATSPVFVSSPVVHTANNGRGSVSITLPARGGTPGFARDAKTRPSVPLRKGRKVAFYNQNPKPGEEAAWILAVVKECIDNTRYQVQDVDGQGDKDSLYTAEVKSIAPLPDLQAPPDSPAHLNAYPEYTQGTSVLALYPETTCFYRAEVLAGPSRLALQGSKARLYKLRFEDDGDQEHTTGAEWVVAWPGPRP